MWGDDKTLIHYPCENWAQSPFPTRSLCPTKGTCSPQKLGAISTYRLIAGQYIHNACPEWISGTQNHPPVYQVGLCPFFLWMSHWTPKILFPMCLIEIGLGVSNLSSLPPFFKLAPAEKRPGNLGNSSEYHWCTCQCKILAWPVVQQYRGSKRHGATF